MKGKGGRKRGQEKNREGEFLYFYLFGQIRKLAFHNVVKCNFQVIFTVVDDNVLS